MSSMRCKLTGCDRDACGVCKRCGDASEAHHSWKDGEHPRPCFKRKVCEDCGVERDQPDHAWEMTEGPLGPAMACSRCGMKI